MRNAESKGTRTILLVESDHGVRSAVSEMLCKAGYFVMQAAEGRSALDRLKNTEREIDLVIMDVFLPEKSGLQVHEEMRRWQQDIKALFTTAYSLDLAREERGITSGLYFIEKPFTQSALLQRVRAALGE